MSRIDKSIVESIVIDWFRNVTSKEKSRWVCDEIEYRVGVVFEVNKDLRRKRRTKNFSFNKLEV